VEPRSGGCVRFEQRGGCVFHLCLFGASSTHTHSSISPGILVGVCVCGASTRRGQSQQLQPRLSVLFLKVSVLEWVFKRSRSREII
jgi:hypothetical protein